MFTPGRISTSSPATGSTPFGHDEGWLQYIYVEFIAIAYTAA
jgi:hypothetical protein